MTDCGKIGKEVLFDVFEYSNLSVVNNIVDGVIFNMCVSYGFLRLYVSCFVYNGCFFPFFQVKLNMHLLTTFNSL